ncbi:unnamed protein product [Periconia digitata]|uniref:F-box domain-containing protein n=1 Tax=Periconia digitata TaxID=1303443 RepID=A0A9W4U6B3_9PLEO|nr:unnamed protein product [Periconia digitata]
MALPTLLGMPLELLVHMIATYLSTTDLGALRLTCKKLETSLFDTFAKEFFTKKQFMLTTRSLSVLVAISKHAALRQRLKHVIIGLDKLNSTHMGLAGRQPEEKEAFRRAFADQTYLRATGSDQRMLAEAFRNLPNLETLGIRDYQASGRRRDGTRWRSYGLTTLTQEIGIRTVFEGSTAEYASEVFMMLLTALVDARKTVPSIEVITRHRALGLRDTAFHVPPNDGFKEVIEKLETLLLTLSLLNSYMPPSNPHDPQIPLAIEFLSHAKNLKHLRINDSFADGGGITTWFLTSMINYPIPPTSSPPAQTPFLPFLPSLTTIDFGKLTLADPGLIFHVIDRLSSSLKNISLWEIKFLDNPASYWTDTEEGKEHRYHPWPALLLALNGIQNLKLDSVKVGRLSFWYDNSWVQILLKDRKQVQEVKGEDVKMGIVKMVEGWSVEWPVEMVVEDEDEDEEDEEEEDEEEEDEEEDDGEVHGGGDEDMDDT